jgi:nicotinate-nucleotide adenylyltransferase
VRIAILGGTFNPVHNGHLHIAEEAKSRFEYQRILFIPANIPAHKEMQRDAGAAHRLRMLELAVAGKPDFLVDDCELRRGGTSYTIDTVHELGRRYPIEGKPGLIIGDDLAEDFHTWRHADELAELADLIVARRQFRRNVEIKYPCRYLDNAPVAISSAEIRDKLSSGSGSGGEQRESVRQWLPPEVFDYIQRHDLYS